MNFKIRGGQILSHECFVKEKHVQKEYRSKELISMFGTLSHHYTDGWGNPNNFVITTEIETAEIITEDNKVNFMGAAGWGIVGGLLTGGVGLLAGAILGGRGKETFCAVRFKDGTQLVVSGSPKHVVTLLSIGKSTRSSVGK